MKKINELLSNVKLIITHPGIFHADDVCAVAYLQLLGICAPFARRLPTPAEMEDPAVLVLDVGNKHMVDTLCFDHHQKGGAGKRWDTEVPYAAFGLVYDWVRPTDEAVASRFEERVVVPVDAAATGWGTMAGTRPVLSSSACVSGFNPGAGATPAARDHAFAEAVAFAQQVLSNEMKSAEEHVAARDVVLSAGNPAALRAGTPAAASAILVLERFVPWTDHIFDRPDANDLLYVVFPSERGGYNVQQVPESAGSFKGRKPLPEAWAGLRGKELAKLIGIADGPAVFCHPGRFICGAETKEEAIFMAGSAVWA